ncbi:hypothetical protein [Rubinisphaera italica]|uniref:Uncharacterized protein n=1 Tax=Rubinisphaera italica TaxID=2527969 RepID=A0A5C5XFF5_9PLAN|nr:hypothetical protein [Rubinisphaera italica]TWT61836.1 hypothetical protein Pan54_25730 [Rubinisphaera italica]
MKHPHENLTEIDAKKAISSPTHRFSRWAFPLLGSCCLVILCGATFGPKLSLRESRDIKQKISSLPQEDRERLDRNLETYQSLSNAEKARYWELHNYIEQNGLEPLIDQYTKWLDTLSPFERQSLRNSPEPAAQIATVESILRENRTQDNRLLPELMARIISKGDRRLSILMWMLDPNWSINNTTPFLLQDEQLNQVVNEILFSQLASAQRDQIEQLKLTGIARMSRILGASIANTNNPRMTWPNQQTLELVRKNGLKLEKPSEEESSRFTRILPAVAWERIAFRSLLLRSLMVSEMRGFERVDQVSNNELQSFFAQLETNQQAALLNSPADYQAEALMWLYLWDTHRNESIFMNHDFHAQVLSELHPFDRRNNGGGPPGGRRPEDERGRDDDRFGPPKDGRERRPDGPPPGRPPGAPPRPVES